MGYHYPAIHHRFYPHAMADLSAMKGMAAESLQHAVAQQQMQAVSWRGFYHGFLKDPVATSLFQGYGKMM